MERSPEAQAADQFRARWSPRAFTGQGVTVEQLQQLFEAARWAPSCFNSQPWRFVYATRDSEHWASLFSLLVDANQDWAHRAGALVALVAKTTFDNDKPAPTHSFDVGSAWMSMALQAREIGLVTHAMWGFHHDRASETLGLPEDFTTQAMVAVGYQADKSVLSEKSQQREAPSQRKSIAEISFAGKLGR